MTYVDYAAIGFVVVCIRWDMHIRRSFIIVSYFTDDEKCESNLALKMLSCRICSSARPFSSPVIGKIGTFPR